MMVWLPKVSTRKVFGLAVATTWEKRDPLTGVKCKGKLQLHVCESVVFVSGGKVLSDGWRL
jgi:hypothetical protein